MNIERKSQATFYQLWSLHIHIFSTSSIWHHASTDPNSIKHKHEVPPPLCHPIHHHRCHSTWLLYNVCDTDGNPLVPGVQYYIVPGITNDAGGLTLESNNGSCPLNVAQSPNNGDLGLPVIFTIANPHKDLIGLGDNIYISFSTSMCAESTGWRITGPDEVSNRYHVSTSKYTGNPLQGTVDNWFRIEQYMNVYRLGFCPNECHDQCGIPQCGVLSVEVVECHRWLVLTGSNERCFPVQFKRAWKKQQCLDGGNGME